MEINETTMAALLEGVAKKNGEYLDGKLAGIERTLQAQGEALRKVGYNGARSETPLSEIITDKGLEGVRNGSARSVTFKVPNSVVNKTEITRSSVTSSTMSYTVPGVGQLPTASTVMRSLFRSEQVGPNSNGQLTYFDQESVTRGADMRAESASKPESAITWIQRSTKIEKIADTIPVTREALRDVNFIQGEINRLLSVNLALKEDAQLYSGDGNTPNLRGVYTVASTFNPAAWTGPSSYDANFYDLLCIMATQISATKEGKYSADTALVHPNDLLRMKLAKGSDGHYVIPSFVSANGTVVSGIKVVATSRVTENTCLLGDFRFGAIYDLEDVTVEVGWVNTQFIENAVTVLAEKRLGLQIRGADEDAFLKCTNVGLAINTLSYS